MVGQCAQSESERELVSIVGGDSETKIGGPAIKPQLAHHLKVSAQPSHQLAHHPRLDHTPPHHLKKAAVLTKTFTVHIVDCEGLHNHQVIPPQCCQLHSQETWELNAVAK